jgi:phage/plasmid-associated DNA primase
VANLNHRRFVVVNEPNDNQRLLSGNMKRLTGDDKINARANYSNNCDTYLDLTIVGEFNKIPTFYGEQDNASIQRLTITMFNNKFTNNQEEIDANEYCKPAQEGLKTTAFWEQYKHALFKYLLDSDNEYYISKKSKYYVNEYLKNSNELFIFVNSVYKIQNNKYMYVRVREIYNKFKESDYYANLNKIEKRVMNERKFKDMIKNDNELGKHYRDRVQYGGLHEKCVLINMREREEEDVDDDDYDNEINE